VSERRIRKGGRGEVIRNSDSRKYCLIAQNGIYGRKGEGNCHRKNYNCPLIRQRRDRNTTVVGYRLEQTKRDLGPPKSTDQRGGAMRESASRTKVSSNEKEMSLGED